MTGTAAISRQKSGKSTWLETGKKILFEV